MNKVAVFSLFFVFVLISVASAWHFNFYSNQIPNLQFNVNKVSISNSVLLSSISISSANAYVSDNAFDWFEIRGSVNGKRSSERILLECSDNYGVLFRAFANVNGNTFAYNNRYLTVYSPQVSCIAKITLGETVRVASNAVQANIILPQ